MVRSSMVTNERSTWQQRLIIKLHVIHYTVTCKAKVDHRDISHRNGLSIRKWCRSAFVIRNQIKGYRIGLGQVKRMARVSGANRAGVGRRTRISKIPEVGNYGIWRRDTTRASVKVNLVTHAIGSDCRCATTADLAHMRGSAGVGNVY